MLARAGVPGLALWLATLLSWFIMLSHNIMVANRRGERRWSNIFIWIACYGGAIVINAAFDVALEGPMLGIWFWCIFGLGIGTSMIYRHHVIAQSAHPPPLMQTELKN
ncbi:MAG: O-antigen ligase domain-containing protein, partial [Pseudomonadota bacterium]